MDPFLRRISRTVDRFSMIGEGERVLVAVSGGADSVALLETLCRLAPGRRWALAAAHLHHGLRGTEADRDESFVRSLADRTGVPLVCRRLEPGILRDRRGRSLEEAARDARYRFLREAAASSDVSRIALGHNRGDQAETVLMNVVRGTGIDGLKGMLPVRDGVFVRPLLYVSRQEILDFLKRQGLPFQEDATNRDQRFFRNRVRRDLLPHLSSRYNRRVTEGLGQLADIARRESDFLEQAVREVLERLGLSQAGPRMEISLDDLAGPPQTGPHPGGEGLPGRPGGRPGGGRGDAGAGPGPGAGEPAPARPVRASRGGAPAAGVRRGGALVVFEGGGGRGLVRGGDGLKRGRRP